MTAKEVAERLRKAGLPVISHREEDEDTDGEVQLTERHSVQVGHFQGDYFCLTYDESDETTAMGPMREKVEDVIADAKAAQAKGLLK